MKTNNAEQLVFNDAGQILHPNLHDSYLIGVIYEENQIKLRFNSYDKKIYELTLINVKKFKCDNLLEGNIVLDVTVLTGEIDVKYLCDIFSVKTQPELPPYILSARQDLLSGELMLVQLTPSYGCEIISLCKSIECFKL